jgi:hypothetical protein
MRGCRDRSICRISPWGPGYKKSGIGKGLIELTREKVGDQTMIVLLSVSTAMEYYPKVRFSKEDRGFIINRKK